VIKSIKLQNYQSHKDSFLEFSPYVNSIAAPSNSGKTAILRGLNWVVTNRPSAESQISHWARDAKGNQIEDTSVTVETDEHTITRYKGKKGNMYILDGKNFEAIGMDVPQEIKDALNISEVNMQYQLDAPFLLSNTPGEVARFFNKIVQLDKIDVYLSAIGTKKHKTKSDLELAKTNLKHTEEDLKRFNWVEKAGQLIDVLEELSSRVDLCVRESGDLKSAVIIYNDQLVILEKTKIVSKCDSIIKEIESLKNQNEQNSSNKYNLSVLTGDYRRYKDTLDNTVYMSKATIIQDKIDELVEKTNQLKQNRDELNVKYNEHKRLSCLINSDVDIIYAEKLSRKIDSISDTNRTVNTNKYQLEKEISNYKESKGVLETAETTFQELQKELPANCPICGSDLSNNNHMEH